MDTSRRDFIKSATLAAGTFLLSGSCTSVARNDKRRGKRPNLVYVFADQWRAQDAGFAGNNDVITENIDKLASESLVFKHTVSCMPVSTPYRGSLLTGQYAHTHGLFLNDVTLDPDSVSIGKVYKNAGYDTGYIGKWHVNGNGKSNYIPETHRQGFDFFKVLECTHNYTHSAYYDNNDPEKKYWKGYDAFAQTEEAVHYMEEHANGEKPFVLFLSWGPPHSPYEVVPEEFLNLYKDKDITLRPNVPDQMKEKATRDLKGYYAHITALDRCVGMLQDAIKRLGVEEDTIFVLTSDHGDMLGSQGLECKQKPYEESIMVPFLLKYPAIFGKKGKEVETILSSVDIMPTLLGMSNVTVPKSVEGKDLSPILRGEITDFTEMALIECIAPFGEWERDKGGKEYRGVRTRRYTYVRDLSGPWLLYDNQEDPYQLRNLVHEVGYKHLQEQLDEKLFSLLKEHGDPFLEGEYYIKQWGYTVNSKGTVEYTP